MAGGEAAPGSRALLPMTPEEENMIRTIAVLQFDSEDNLVLVADGERPGSESYYYFRNLTEDENTPNGTPVARTGQRAVAVRRRAEDDDLPDSQHDRSPDRGPDPEGRRADLGAVGPISAGKRWTSGIF